MDRRTFLRAGLGSAGALLLEGCTRISGPGERRGPRTLRLPGGDFGFPSPFAYSPPGYGRLIYIYDTLLTPSPKDATRPVPWLAAEYQRSPDNLVYTFRLRTDVKWQDGRPLTAQDVVFSFDYFKAKRDRLPPFLIVDPKDVARVDAPDPLSVQVTLDKPAVTFPINIAALFPIAPRHIWEGVDNPAQVQDEKMLLGSGPYRLNSYESGKGLYLYTANEGYFLGRPLVKRLEFRAVGDELSALRTGDIDAGGFGTRGANEEALRPFREDESFGFVEGEPEFPAVLFWNLGKGGALKDVRFRRACCMAIDRKDMVKRLLGGKGEPGNPGFLPPDHPYRISVEQYSYNPDKANRLLDGAGYKARRRDGIRLDPDGKPLSFTMLALPDLAGAFSMIKAFLQKIGVEVRADPVEFFTAFGTLSSGNYEMALIFYGGVAGDPDYMRTVYSSKIAERPFHHAQGYADAEMDALADRQLVTENVGERKKLVARMQQIAARDVPFLHLYYPRIFMIYRKDAFKGIEPDEAFSKQILVTGRKGAGEQARTTP